MAAPRILTFNFHEPYLCMMAEIGYRLFVGVYDSGYLARPWHTEYRPLPPNLTLLPEAQWRQELKAGQFDLAIAHNENNALDIFRAPCPKLLVCHNRRNFLEEAAVVEEGDARELFGELVRKLQEAFTFVFISESKRDSYGVPGRVILPGIDVDAWGGYAGGQASVLRVGNMMRERNLMFDVDVQEAACAGLPGRVVGFNPGIPESAPTSSFPDLLSLYRSHRCLLHVTREAYEDGYNLAMLEAMACGMPVVSLRNATSPITHGVDGLMGETAASLREQLQFLITDHDSARAIGARGREMVAEKFSLESFRENWRAAIEEAVGGSSQAAGHAEKPRRKLLLEYMASPITTGRYFEEAARAVLEVKTAGFRVPEKLLESWGFVPPIPAYEPHDVYVPLEHSFAQIRTLLPDNFTPDLYLWIDSGPKDVPEDVRELACPKVGYLIDTHIAPEARLEMARHFDITFIAQKAQLNWFRAAGIRNVFWLPLACSPGLHQIPAKERTLDIAYVGSLSEEEGNRRRLLLEQVRAAYPNHFVGRAWPQEMAEIYGRARIVVNACVNRDLNMRVFEGMAAGALLLTDEAEGLQDLFEDGRHLVVYHGAQDLIDKIAYYLEHEAERDAIAAAGRAFVLKEHTYGHRLEELLHMTDEILDEPGGAEDQWDPEGYYQCPRPELMPHIPLHAQRVLDVGCGAGAFGYSLKKQAGVKHVTGMEIVPAAAEKARRVLDEVVLGNIEEMDLPWEDDTFDCIVCADVLEHLVEPVPAIQKLARVLAPEGVLVISMPNTQFYEAVAMLSQGQWTYMDRGIMDRTHLRFYTRPALAKLMTDAGLQVAQLGPLSAAGPEKLPRKDDGSVRLGKLHFHSLSDEEYNAFLVYQYLILACKPGVDRLARARQALDSENNEAAYALALDAIGVDEVERHQIAAKALARMGQLEQAEQHYQQALKLKPSAINVAGEYGILLVAMNRVSEAKPLLERTLDEKQGSDRVLGAMGLVLLTEGRHAEAFDCFGRALEANYDNISLVRHYIDTAAQLGRQADAEPLVRRFAEFYPGNTDLACEHARLLLELDRAEEARDRLEMILLLSPRCQPAKELLMQIDGEDASP